MNVSEERTSVLSEKTDPPSMYSAPPELGAEQFVKEREDRVSVASSDNIADIAPPFSDMH